MFDADLAFTKDGKLVLQHSWSDNLEQGEKSFRDSYQFTDRNGHIQYTTKGYVMEYQEFMKTKKYYKYTSMSCEDMIEFMELHQDLYVACDMKDDVADSYQYLVNKAIEMSAKTILDRIIVNIYDYDTYNVIMDIYTFRNVTARQHYVSPNNYYELTKFCLDNNIHVVNVSSCYVKDEGVQLMLSKGIHVYIAIADYISDLQEYRDIGVSGAVTNWLYEEDWSYTK